MLLNTFSRNKRREIEKNWAKLAVSKCPCLTFSTQYFSRSYNNFSSGANLTPYSGIIIFWGAILTPKRSLNNSFSGVKWPQILRS